MNPADRNSSPCLPARVEAYSSFAYAVEPRVFEANGVTHRTAAVVRQWRAPGQIHFYVRDERAEFFELTYDEPSDQWTVREFGKDCPIPPKADTK